MLTKSAVPWQAMTRCRTDESEAAVAASRLAAQLMRAIGAEIAQRIVPELTSADTLERASFARLVLANLAADLDVLPSAAAEVAPALRRDIAATLAAADGADPVLEECRARLGNIREETGAGVARELAELRDLAGRVLRRVSDGASGGSSEAPALHAAVAALGRCDAAWIASYDAACAAAAGAATPDSTGATAQSVVEPVTIENFNAYLRRRFPGRAAVAAFDLVPIPGGRSKKTFFVRITGVDSLPGNLVMRQDFALKYASTRVVDEYRPLLALAELGLPVPRPFHLETESSELGPPFILVERLKGRPPGTYFGMSTPCPSAFRDLAAMLATLHRVEPATLGMERPSDGRDNMRQLIEQYQAKWRENATRASPVVDYAYGWALRECGRDPGRTAVVHGDAGPYNLLVDEDRLDRRPRLGVRARRRSRGGPGCSARLFRQLHAVGGLHAGVPRRRRTRGTREPHPARDAHPVPQGNHAGRRLWPELPRRRHARLHQGRELLHGTAADRAKDRGHAADNSRPSE